MKVIISGKELRIKVVLNAFQSSPRFSLQESLPPGTAAMGLTGSARTSNPMLPDNNNERWSFYIRASYNCTFP